MGSKLIGGNKIINLLNIKMKHTIRKWRETERKNAGRNNVSVYGIPENAITPARATVRWKTKNQWFLDIESWLSEILYRSTLYWLKYDLELFNILWS